jgi:beta-glucanase (GH16 family)
MFVTSLILITQAKTVLFRDDFNATELDSQKWRQANWSLGRTQFGAPPVLTDGRIVLTHHTYNPKAPGESFLGTEIYTEKVFERGNGIEIEAKVRAISLPPGLVTSLFTYSSDKLGSDEIDFEFLSNEVNSAPKGQTPVLLTNWNDWDEAKELYGDQVHHSSETVKVKDLNLAKFNTFTIRWLPTKTEWLINGNIVRESDKAVPNMASAVRINFWAAKPAWKEAFSALYQPSKVQSENKVSRYEVEYVEVRKIQKQSSVSRK